MSADAVKNVAKICEGIDLTQLATGDEAIDNSCSFSTSVTSCKEPVLATDRNDPKHTFSKIVHLRRQIHLM
jgi:hypothetical protein